MPDINDMPDAALPATLILHSGRLHTCDDAGRTVEAIAIRGNRIIEVGSDKQILGHTGPGTRVVDLAGRCAIPGMTDGHAHMDREGLRRQLPGLDNAPRVDDILDILEAQTHKLPEGSWIILGPIGQPPDYATGSTGLTNARIPNRYDLDRVSPRHPVFIRSIWGYWRGAIPLVSVANSLALARAGVGPHTHAPSPEIDIETDDQGVPTGVFFEHTLVPLVEHTLMRCAPGFTAAQRTDALHYAMGQYNRCGTTAVFEGHGVASEVLEAYKTVHASGARSVRAVLTFSPNWHMSGRGDAAQLLSDWGAWLSGRGMGDAFVRMQGVYAELDTEPENNRLRASNHPCTGWAGFQAGSALPQAALEALVVEAARSNIRLCGIWPNMLALFERANRANSIESLRWVWGHQSVLDGEQIARVKDLGLVITTHTNRHIFKDGDRLMERQAQAVDDIVPLQRLLRAGVPVAFGSDNLPPSLFGPIWHATSRLSRSGQAVAPNQAITREQALTISTRGGAWLTLDEDQRGEMAPGKLADLVVLSADVLVCPADALMNIHAEMVFVNGREIPLPPVSSDR